jgi:SPASM domain peptide maturase of grasp-with-spasm system
MALPTDKYIRLFACCTVTRGVQRAVITDTQRYFYELVPNSLIDVLKMLQSKTLGEVLETYADEKDTLLSYLDFLLEKDMIFTVDESQKDFFDPLPVQWDYPGLVSNAIFDADAASLQTIDYGKLIAELDGLGCKYLQVRFFEQVDMELVASTFFPALEHSRFRYLELLVPASPGMSRQDYIDFFAREPRCVFQTIHGADAEDIHVYEHDSQKKILFTPEKITGHHHCGQVGPLYFALHLNHHMEGQLYNTCLNRKIGVDADGFIRNCPSLPEVYGNVSNTGFKEALSVEGFNKYSQITKQQVETCNSCEFRNICTDCRAFRKNDADILSKPAKCNYNPHTCEWE